MTTRRTHAFTQPTRGVPEPYRQDVERALQERMAREDELEEVISDGSTSASATLTTHIADTTTHGISAFGATVVDDASAVDVRNTIAAAGAGAIGSSGLTMNTARLLGRTTASAGAVEEITAGSGLSLAAGSLSATATSFTDEAAQDAVGGILTGTSTIDLTYIDGTPSITADVIADSIGNTHLRNSGARSVIGRSANSSGDPADISGTGTSAIPTVLSDNGTTADWRSLAGLGGAIVYDVDFSSLSTNAFTDGTETVDGINYTVANSSRAGSEWGVSSGSGIVISAPASTANTWTTAATTSAPYFYAALSSWANIDYGKPLIIDVYFSSQTYENGNDAIRVGLWGVAATPTASYTARARIGDRGNSGGTQNIRTFDGTTATAHADAHNFNCLSVRVDPLGQLHLGVGTYSSGWPVFSYEHVLTASLASTTLLHQPTTRLVFVWINASDASPTSRVTIARMRIRQ